MAEAPNAEPGGRQLEENPCAEAAHECREQLFYRYAGGVRDHLLSLLKVTPRSSERPDSSLGQWAVGRPPGHADTRGQSGGPPSVRVR